MDENLIFDLTRQALWIAVRMSAPLLAVALVEGVVIGLFEALTSVEMFKEVRAALPGVKLLANMTEFGRTPAQTAKEFEELGYDMVIWPVSSLRVANKAQAKLYATLARDGATTAMLPEMQTRQELYDTIGLNEFEALDASIAASVAPDWKV